MGNNRWRIEFLLRTFEWGEVREGERSRKELNYDHATGDLRWIACLVMSVKFFIIMGCRERCIALDIYFVWIR